MKDCSHGLCHSLLPSPVRNSVQAQGIVQLKLGTSGLQDTHS